MLRLGDSLQPLILFCYDMGPSLVTQLMPSRVLGLLSDIASPPLLSETGSLTDPEISDSARTAMSVSAFPAWSLH